MVIAGIEAFTLRLRPADTILVTRRKPRLTLLRTLVGTVGLAAGCSFAQAGDLAQLNILGFSKDGAVFAFEEYGVQDGSGFPYANRFYIDTENDSFVAGSPVRVRLEDEQAGVETAREQAKKQGETILRQAELDENRGYTAGINAITELSADPARMAVNPRPVMPAIDEPLEFRLETLPLQQTGSCLDVTQLVGFRLLRIEAGGAAKTVHADTAVPKSRGCPYAYRLGAIQTFSAQNLSAFAVLIAIESVGFEGPDVRWLAVTGRP